MNKPREAATGRDQSHPLPAAIGREGGAINIIQFYASHDNLGGFTSPYGVGKTSLYASAHLEGARGVFLTLKAHPIPEEKIPSEAAHAVFHAARRLIEAAPDLLTALKEVVAEADAYEAKHGPMSRPWVRIARNAIATAEGRAPK